MSAALNIELFVGYMNGCPVVSGNITYSLFYNHIFLVRPQGYVMPLSSSIILSVNLELLSTGNHWIYHVHESHPVNKIGTK
jgi:hypothetical protein